jgi:hypothetical protein
LLEQFVWNSGKLLILGIVAAAALLAGAGWWFRYNATHRAAAFWGPEATVLIRDAPRIVYRNLQSFPPDSEHEVSSARGLTHLRNALIEDRSFDWPASSQPLATKPARLLEFRSGSEATDPTLLLYFSPDLDWVAVASSDGAEQRTVSCRPIAKGLAEMFEEFAEAPPTR